MPLGLPRSWPSPKLRRCFSSRAESVQKRGRYGHRADIMPKRGGPADGSASTNGGSGCPPWLVVDLWFDAGHRVGQSPSYLPLTQRQTTATARVWRRLSIFYCIGSTRETLTWWRVPCCRHHWLCLHHDWPAGSLYAAWHIWQKLLLPTSTDAW